MVAADDAGGIFGEIVGGGVGVGADGCHPANFALEEVFELWVGFWVDDDKALWREGDGALNGGGILLAEEGDFNFRLFGVVDFWGGVHDPEGGLLLIG